MMPTQECRASGSPLEATGLMGDELGADQRCSIGAGAGVLSASSCCISSCINFKSAPDGFLHRDPAVSRCPAGLSTVAILSVLKLKWMQASHQLTHAV